MMAIFTPGQWTVYFQEPFSPFSYFLLQTIIIIQHPFLMSSRSEKNYREGNLEYIFFGYLFVFTECSVFQGHGF